MSQLKEYDVHKVTTPFGIGKHLDTIVAPDLKTADIIASHLFDGTLFVSPAIAPRRRSVSRDFRPDQVRKKYRRW